MLVDGEEPKMHKGRVKIQRDQKPKQITIQREGYKDRNVVIAPFRINGLTYLSLLFAYYPYEVDLLSPKAYDYPPELNLSTYELLQVVERSEESKEVQLNKVRIDVDEIRVKYCSQYKRYYKGKWDPDNISGRKGEDIKLENTVFSGYLNTILREKGYIDTTRKVLKNSYLNNMLIDATINKYESIIIDTDYGTGFQMVDLGIEWTILDYYEQEVFTFTTEVTSDQFPFRSKGDFTSANISATIDALEIGLFQLMENEEVIKQLNDRSSEQEEASFEPIALANSGQFVSSLGESIKSSVTISNENGHGSGFIVSSDGHIVTNYHVVMDAEDLKVTLNNDTEYTPEIVRVSKISDLALLKIDAEGLLPFRVNYSEDIEIAQDIYAVGTPTGTDLNQTVSKGIISGVRKNDDGSKLIQTDASINAGNSGGAIVNKEGLVLGVVSSKYFGFGVEGVAFGIPAFYIKERLKLE